MNFLVTNDDGIFAEGIKVLSRELLKHGDISVVAPGEEQSGVGRAISIHKSLRFEKYNMGIEDITAYSVSGTPTDCILLALTHILDDGHDIVVSGINRGLNIGTDVQYSGTVSAALEGARRGMQAIAVSQDVANGWVKGDYQNLPLALEKAFDILEKIKLPIGTIININLPAKKALGIKVAPIAEIEYDDAYVEIISKSGASSYILSGERIKPLPDEETDHRYIEEGYITITPIRVEMTEYSLIDKIQEILDE